MPAPPVAPGPILIPTTTESAKPPPTLPSAPRMSPAPPKEPALTVEVKPEAAPPPASVKPQRRPNRKKATEAKVEAPKPDPAGEPATPTASPPKLEQMLTTEQTQAFSSRLSASLDRVRGSLVVIQTKSLSAEQKEVVTRIKTFVTQAEQTREQDLISAVNLAERADVLSRDLLERLR